MTTQKRYFKFKVLGNYYRDMKAGRSYTLQPFTFLTPKNVKFYRTGVKIFCLIGLRVLWPGILYRLIQILINFWPNSLSKWSWWTICRFHKYNITHLTLSIFELIISSPPRYHESSIMVLYIFLNMKAQNSLHRHPL